MRELLGMPVRSQGSVESAGGDSPLPGVVPPVRTASTPSTFTVDNAMGLSAVYRAVSVLITAGSQLQLHSWRNAEVIDPQPGIVAQPDPLLSQRQFIKRTLSSLATCGEAFWRRSSPAGELIGLQVLNPLNMSVWRNERNRIVYSYYDADTGRRVDLTERQVEHLKLMEVPGQLHGLGPLQAYRAGVVGALDLRSYADQWYRPRDVPTGVLSSDQLLTAPEAEQYRAQWHQLHAGGDEIAVLGKGLKYDPIWLKPADAQFIEAQQFNVTDVARVYGIPAPYMLAAVEGSAMTYTNMLELNTGFVRFTLLQYLNEIEDAFTRVTPRGQTARFDLSGLLRADDKTRYETYKLGVDGGWLDGADVREAEQLKPKHIERPAAAPAAAATGEDTTP